MASARARPPPAGELWRAAAAELSITLTPGCLRTFPPQADPTCKRARVDAALRKLDDEPTEFIFLPEGPAFPATQTPLAAAAAPSQARCRQTEQDQDSLLPNLGLEAAWPLVLSPSYELPDASDLLLSPGLMAMLE